VLGGRQASGYNSNINNGSYTRQQRPPHWWISHQCIGLDALFVVRQQHSCFRAPVDNTHPIPDVNKWSKPVYS
jgi:hypothetical protein